MRQYKFQIPQSTIEVRGQLFPFLIKHHDVKIIKDKTQLEDDRILIFSHPFDNWVFDVIVKNKYINFFHLDNGYIGNHLYKTPNWYRISYNSMQNVNVLPTTESRIDTLEITDQFWSDWDDSGDYNLLVLPNQSNIFRYLGEDYNNWREKTIAHYEKLDTPLVIREKIGKRRQRFEEIIPLIKNSKKVIVYHSMTAVEAICLGKPVEILGQSAVQKWNNQFGFNRNEMLEHIAWSQYSRRDFATGYAWSCTLKYQLGDNAYART